jgi:hypothetical protein
MASQPKPTIEQRVGRAAEEALAQQRPSATTTLITTICS